MQSASSSSLTLFPHKYFYTHLPDILNSYYWNKFVVVKEIFLELVLDKDGHLEKVAEILIQIGQFFER